MQDVIVKSTGTLYRTEVCMDGHQWFADEPVTAGGGDTAAPPTALLLSGLGACTTITLQMYARHKGWPLQGVTVTLRHATQTDASITTTHITREIVLDGPLAHEQKLRLMEIAEACPIHKMLVNPVEIRSVLLRHGA